MFAPWRVTVGSYTRVGSPGGPLTSVMSPGLRTSGSACDPQDVRIGREERGVRAATCSQLDDTPAQADEQLATMLGAAATVTRLRELRIYASEDRAPQTLRHQLPTVPRVKPSRKLRIRFCI